MITTNIRAKAIDTIAAHLGRSPDEIQEDKRIIEDLNADSLDIVELTMAIEEEFNLEVLDSEVQHVKTVGDVLKIIYDKQGTAGL